MAVEPPAPLPAPPWMRPDALLPVPPGAAPWGSVTFHGEAGEPRFREAADAEELGRHIGAESKSPVYFAWGPGRRHIGTVYEIDGIAEPVAARGLRDAKVRQSDATPRALLAIGLIVGGIFFWPAERSLQALALLAAILIVLPMWQRGVEVVFDSWRERRRLSLSPADWRLREARRLRFAIWSQGRSSVGALGLVGAFVVLFLLTLWVGRGATFDRFALVKSRVGEETWRLLTCAFLHGSFIHLFFNGAAGLSLAGVARVFVRESDILFTFLVAALAGSAASSLLMPGADSIGASGGILGWGGLLLGIALCRKELAGTGLVSNMVRWVVLLAAIGLAGAGFIDNAAHAGGFAAGLLIGVLIARNPEFRVPENAGRPGRSFWMLAAGLGAVALWMAVTLVHVKLG